MLSSGENELACTAGAAGLRLSNDLAENLSPLFRCVFLYAIFVLRQARPTG